MAYTGLVYSGNANRGIDRTITLRRNDNGQEILLGGRLASIEWSEKDAIEEVDGIDNNGLTDHSYHAGGITGSLTINRYNNDYEDFAKFYNANFYGGGGSIYATIIATTRNRFDDSEGTDTFTFALLGQLKSGPFGSKSNPKVTITFHAQERK